MSLHWYPTCGCPVVLRTPDSGGLVDDAGAPCPPMGASCTVQGQRCGGQGFCQTGEVCEVRDPTKTPPGCPISSRKYKDAIEYVDSAGLQQLHDETVGMRLATYNYKPEYDDPNPKHLGFIIEDRPRESPAVDWSHDRVDIYGYLSMVVATMQVQEREIAELRQALDVANAGNRACTGVSASESR